MPSRVAEDVQQLQSDVKQAFASDAGIATLRWLSSICLEGQNPYVVGQFDQTARNCGKLEIMIKIRKMLAADGLPRQDKVIQTEKEE